MEELRKIHYEINYMTEDTKMSRGIIDALKSEFDLIQLWRSMMRPFGYDASEILDRFMALSLRKLLCDEKSILKMICPGFLMPPLSGSKLEVPGDNHELMDVSIHPSMRIRRQKDWIPLESWLNERIAWIDKDATSIPDAYEDLFFKKIANKVNNNEFIKLFDCKTIIEKDKPLLIWELKDKSLLGRQQVYNFLKDKGYYDLTIKRMIKHFADKEGAHWDRNRTGWISVINSSDQYGSAISVLALHMIYAATKQIKELEDYYTYISPIEIME